MLQFSFFNISSSKKVILVGNLDVNKIKLRIHALVRVYIIMSKL